MSETPEHRKAADIVLPSTRTRAYIYRVLVTLGPVAAFYGLLDQQEVVLWLAVAAQTLGVGLAAVHTSTRSKQ